MAVAHGVWQFHCAVSGTYAKAAVQTHSGPRPAAGYPEVPQPLIADRPRHHRRPQRPVVSGRKPYCDCVPSSPTVCTHIRAAGHGPTPRRGPPAAVWRERAACSSSRRTCRGPLVGVGWDPGRLPVAWWRARRVACRLARFRAKPQSGGRQVARGRVPRTGHRPVLAPGAPRRGLQHGAPRLRTGAGPQAVPGGRAVRDRGLSPVRTDRARWCPAGRAHDREELR